MEKRPKWKTTKMEDDKLDHNINGRQPTWKMTKMEDDKNGRRPKWKKDQNGRRPEWKTTKTELKKN